MRQTDTSCLRNFPIASFAMVMGLGGITIAWERAEDVLQLPFRLSPYLLILATVTFAVLAALYSAKALKYRIAVYKEWADPIKINFVPTFSIGLILLSIAWLPVSTTYAFLLWATGSSLQLLLTLYIVTRWVHHGQFEITHLNPAWFIPVVGNILVPVAGVQLAPPEISWFFFSLGLMFWPILLSIIFYRVIFHGSLPERLMPTLFILIAPPAVGFIAYFKLTGSIDAFSHFLFNCGLFFTLLLFFQAKWFTRLRFYLSWWAYSFPLAAITVAALIMVQNTGSLIYLRLSGLLLGISSVVVIGLFLRTLTAVKRREGCIED